MSENRGKPSKVIGRSGLSGAILTESENVALDAVLWAAETHGGVGSWRDYHKRVRDAALAHAEQVTQLIRDALEDMVDQFAYRSVVSGRSIIGSGGLSALEHAFDALGMDDPCALADWQARGVKP